MRKFNFFLPLFAILGFSAIAGTFPVATVLKAYDTEPGKEWSEWVYTLKWSLIEVGALYDRPLSSYHRTPDIGHIDWNVYTGKDRYVSFDADFPFTEDMPGYKEGVTTASEWATWAFRAGYFPRSVRTNIFLVPNEDECVGLYFAYTGDSPYSIQKPPVCGRPTPPQVCSISTSSIVFEHKINTASPTSKKSIDMHVNCTKAANASITIGSPQMTLTTGVTSLLTIDTPKSGGVYKMSAGDNKITLTNVVNLLTNTSVPAGEYQASTYITVEIL